MILHALSRGHYNDIARESFFQLTLLRHREKALCIYSKRKNAVEISN